MPSSKYRLTYFSFKGRAELIRLVFRAARVPFEDRRIALSDWKDFKPKTPTGTLPMLEVDGKKFVESGAITFWAARKFGLMGKTDAEELRTLAIVLEATEFRETYIIPLYFEQDPKKIESLKKALEAGAEKMFSTWDATVIQTESTGRKIFSYMVTQSMTAGDLAVLYVADLTQYFIQVDWACFPRLKAVIDTVSNVPHIKTYLTERDTAENTHKTHDTPQPPPETPRNEATPKSHTSSKPLATPRSQGKPGSQQTRKAMA